MSNFIQGSLWKDMTAKFQNKIVMPLFLFFDDYENNNPLGSHKGVAKCGAVYLSIPCLPLRLRSKLRNIFLFILFNTLDRKVFSNAIIFLRVIDELEFLEKNGVEVDCDGEVRTIYFKLALILGDNLGLHSILGFRESFNCPIFCRFCKLNKQNLQTVTEEADLLRTENNYIIDLEKDEEKETGIVEPCIFHKIPDFYVTKNLSVDVMHDVLEGICQYDLGLILHALIAKKFFTLEELNYRVKAFDYGLNKNKPPEILSSHIKIVV